MRARSAVLTADLSHIRIDNQALQVRTAAMYGTVKEKTDSLATSNRKVRALKSDLDGRNCELVMLKKTDRRAKNLLTDSDSRRSVYVSSGAFLNMDSVSAARLGDQSFSGWRGRRDQALVSIISKCVADIHNTLFQSDNATQSI